jgi:serine/threonine protein kinase
LGVCHLPAGELLGAGSFGRVYRGRWNGMEVAMKVIEHDASSAMEVENEVLLLMGLRHECIMAAYHCARYTRSNSAVPASPAATASAELSSMSSNGFLPSHSAAQQVPNGNTSKSSERDKPDKRARQRAESHLVMEFCDCGTLAHTVATLMSRQPQSSQQQQQQADHVMPLQVLLLLQDVARGLKAIHSRNIVHGDLVSWRASNAQFDMAVLLCAKAQVKQTCHLLV